MRPAVDIIVIMTNISQKIGVRSISRGRTSCPDPGRDPGSGIRDPLWDLGFGIWFLGFADRNPWAARTPTPMKINPYRISAC